MEAMLIGIPFLLYVYFRIRFGNDKTNFERDSELFSEGINLYQSEDYAKSFRYFESAIYSKPKSAFAYFYRGKSHFAFENWESALHDFDKTLRLENTIPEIFYFKSLCHIYLEQFEEAKNALKRASRMYLDKNAEILIHLAETEIRLADFENARKTLKIAEDLGNEKAISLRKTLFFGNNLPTFQG